MSTSEKTIITGDDKPASLYNEIGYEATKRASLGSFGSLGYAGLATAGTLGVLIASACSSDKTTNPIVYPAVISLPLTSDTDILKFALFLELLESDFYTKAVASGVLSGPVATLCASIQRHEAAHVAALQAALGANAFTANDVGFNFGTALASQASFLATSQTLEMTGVGAYLGALPSISSKAVRTTAGSIFTMECRHYSAIRVFNNAPGGPVPNAFETGVPAATVLAAVKSTNFVTKGLG
ncbi:MAG: ferritin-like domain-containing protein [Gemmatimonadaceae bacterium]